MAKNVWEIGPIFNANIFKLDLALFSNLFVALLFCSPFHAILLVRFLGLNLHKVENSFNADHPSLEISPRKSKRNDVIWQIQSIRKKKPSQRWVLIRRQKTKSNCKHVYAKGKESESCCKPTFQSLSRNSCSFINFDLFHLILKELFLNSKGPNGCNSVDRSYKTTHNWRTARCFNSNDFPLSAHIVSSQAIAKIPNNDYWNYHKRSWRVNANRKGPYQRK